MNFKKILLIIVLAVLAGVAYFGYHVYRIVFVPNTAFETQELTVYIPSDADFFEIRALLEPHLKDWDLFEKLAIQKKYNYNIKSGKFSIPKGANNNSILNALRQNIPVKVTFNNQERIENLAGRVAEQIEADSLSLLKAFMDPSFLEVYALDSLNALALVIPNTYEFYWNTNATQFRDRMAKEYLRFWNEDRKRKAANLGLSQSQVIVLAAIVHKESAKSDERPRVAGVYLNRLQKGMKLQADPTVIYAVKKVSNNFDLEIKRVLYADLEVDSEYNTYKYEGLPPGPIFMPDVSAIDAVLNPEKHNYYYFCASVTNFGYHEFATTLSQHEVNRKKYQKWINQQGIKR